MSCTSPSFPFILDLSHHHLLDSKGDSEGVVAAAELPSTHASSHDGALVVYTSDTTGKPKVTALVEQITISRYSSVQGVLHTHCSLENGMRDLVAVRSVALFFFVADSTLVSTGSIAMRTIYYPFCLCITYTAYSIRCSYNCSVLHQRRMLFG